MSGSISTSWRATSLLHSQTALMVRMRPSMMNSRHHIPYIPLLSFSSCQTLSKAFLKSTKIRTMFQMFTATNENLFNCASTCSSAGSLGWGDLGSPLTLLVISLPRDGYGKRLHPLFEQLFSFIYFLTLRGHCVYHLFPSALEQFRWDFVDLRRLLSLRSA